MSKAFSKQISVVAAAASDIGQAFETSGSSAPSIMVAPAAEGSNKLLRDINDKIRTGKIDDHITAFWTPSTITTTTIFLNRGEEPSLA